MSSLKSVVDAVSLFGLPKLKNKYPVVGFNIISNPLAPLEAAEPIIVASPLSPVCVLEQLTHKLIEKLLPANVSFKLVKTIPDVPELLPLKLAALLNLPEHKIH